MSDIDLTKNLPVIKRMLVARAKDIAIRAANTAWQAGLAVLAAANVTDLIHVQTWKAAGVAALAAAFSAIKGGVRAALEGRKVVKASREVQAVQREVHAILEEHLSRGPIVDVSAEVDAAMDAAGEPEDHPARPVVVTPDADADEMNVEHGESYGVDWEYPNTPVASVEPIVHDSTQA